MKKFKKYLPIIIGVILLVAIAYFGLSRKGKSVINNAIRSNSLKKKTPQEAWKQRKEIEFSKDVFYNNKSYKAQVKNINGKDYALLPDGQILVWVDTGVYVDGKPVGGGITPSSWQLYTKTTF